MDERTQLLEKSFHLIENRDYSNLAKSYRSLDASYEQLFIKILIFGSAAATIAISSIAMNSNFEALSSFRIGLIIFTFTVAMIFAGITPFIASNYYEHKTSEAFSRSSLQNYEKALQEVLRVRENNDDPLAELVGQQAYCLSQIENYRNLVSTNERLSLDTKVALKRYLIVATLSFGFGIIQSLNYLFGIV